MEISKQPPDVTEHLGWILELIDRASARLPEGVALDEAAALDTAVAAVRKAIPLHDPSRGPLLAWLRVVAWRTVANAARDARRRSPATSPLENPDDGTTIEIPDARAEEAQREILQRVAIEETARRLSKRRPAPANTTPARSEIAFSLIAPCEVAARLGVSVRTTYRYLHTGEIPSVRIGRLLRVHPGDIEAWLVKNAGENRRVS